MPLNPLLDLSCPSAVNIFNIIALVLFMPCTRVDMFACMPIHAHTTPPQPPKHTFSPSTWIILCILFHIPVFTSFYCVLFLENREIFLSNAISTELSFQVCRTRIVDRLWPMGEIWPATHFVMAFELGMVLHNSFIDKCKEL